MNIEEFKLKIKTLDIDIKKINDQKTNIAREMFPYIGKCIEVERQNTLWYIKCNNILFEDYYYKFKGLIIKVQEEGFSFNTNTSLDINPPVIQEYKFREVSEDDFNACMEHSLLDIIHCALQPVEEIENINTEKPEVQEKDENPT